MRLIGDLLDGLEADEGRLAAVLPQTHRLDRRADRAALAAVLVHDDVGLDALAVEARFDEIDLRLHRRQVVLRAALQHEVRAEGRQVGDLRDVEPDVLRQHRGQAGHDLLRLPALALEIDDVGLHEDGAAVAEARHRLGAEGDVGVLLDLEAEAFGGGLQEVAVAGRALRVELEVLDLAVLQDDELDVLAADVADHVDVVVEVQGRLGVRDRLHQRHVRAQRILQDVLGVAGRADAEDLQRRRPALTLAGAACRRPPWCPRSDCPCESW